jgi:hypothetical protein
MNIGDIELSITPPWAIEASLRFNKLLKSDQRVPNDKVRFHFREEGGKPVYSIEKVTLDLPESELLTYTATCIDIFKVNKNL